MGRGQPPAGQRPARIRVLHLTTEFPPVIYGGLGTAVGGWVTASARAGIAVAVELVEGPLVLDPSVGAIYGGIRDGRSGNRWTSTHLVEGPHGIEFLPVSWARAADAGISLIRSWHPDVVHLHTAMLWPVARVLQEQTGTPLVYHVHSVDRAEYEIGHEPNPWLAMGEAQGEAILAADRVIALSRSERDLIARYYPLASGRVRVVGNGIDDSAAENGALTQGARSDGLMVLYAGRLVERKGIRDLLAAIPSVLAAEPTTRFVFAGGPPPLSGPEVAAQWLGPELHPYRDQIMFTGWLAPADVMRWYRRADILVVPSRYEPFGMVILEGMLHGLAIVASALGGPAEILVQGHTGLLTPPGDVDSITGAVLLLVRDSELRGRLGRGAAAEVRRRWTWPRRVTPMRRVYEELLRS